MPLPLSEGGGREECGARLAARPTSKVKHSKEQQHKLLEWAAEGLTRKEIAARAAAFDPPFEADWNNIKHAREKASKKYAEIKEEFENEAMKQGLARKAVRLREMSELYEKHLALIQARGKEMDGEVRGGETGLMARDYKGKDADRPVYKYDAPLIREMRGILDDIAKELGERKTNVDMSSSGEIILRVQYGDDGSQRAND